MSSVSYSSSSWDEFYAKKLYIELNIETDYDVFLFLFAGWILWEFKVCP